ncbi:MAG TPA: M23 family metallopeptidase, partial [Gracilimonas sp.]|nr:M23 family metallopeptidase [Gracilimonas sp.]
VVKAGTGRGYGKMVRIKHGDGYETVYAHMSKISVKEGDTVKKGDEVGRAGNTGTSTGVHLHFEIIKDGTHLNPESYIRF